MWRGNKAIRKPICNETVPLKVFSVSLCQGNISLVEEQNAVPSMGQSEIDVEGLFNLPCNRAEVTLSLVSVRQNWFEVVSIRTYHT